VIPTVEQVRQMSVDARGGAGVPASRPVASSKSSRVGVKAPQSSRVGEASGEKTGMGLVVVAVIVLVAVFVIGGVVLVRGLRQGVQAGPVVATSPMVSVVVCVDGGVV
jgi:hypothetical protein